MNETPPDQLTTALKFFKDWTNYLLVTTVAALGWAAEGTHIGGTPRVLCVWFLAVSIAFGIFTLALIPLVQEQRTVYDRSNYDVRAKFWGGSLRLIYVCFPQHVLFIAGIITYALAKTLG